MRAGSRVDFARADLIAKVASWGAGTLLKAELKAPVGVRADERMYDLRRD